MIRTLTLSTSFNAIHTHDDRPAHGHRLILRATITVGTNSGTAELWSQLVLIRSELHQRVVETMLPGVDSSALGLANWAFERLSGPLPKLESVSVSEDDELGETGTVTRTIR